VDGTAQAGAAIAEGDEAGGEVGGEGIHGRKSRNSESRKAEMGGMGNMGRIYIWVAWCVGGRKAESGKQKWETRRWRIIWCRWGLARWTGRIKIKSKIKSRIRIKIKIWREMVG